MPQKVYLVGAGPGDPELLTRKAWRVLAESDVILHDDLVSEAILRILPAAAQIVNVGKRCGNKVISQSEINALMVQFSREGKKVVRLKNGDPLLFGRAGEELEALRHAGIEVEVIPGVTSALAAAAAAGISLTDRRHASRVVFVTAHREGGKGLAHEHDLGVDTTVVIYMPGNRYAELARELQAAGIASETPCLVISHASTESETMRRTNVADLAQCPAPDSPSLLIVGEVAATARDQELVARQLFSKLNMDFSETAGPISLQDISGRSSGE